MCCLFHFGPVNRTLRRIQAPELLLKLPDNCALTASNTLVYAGL